MGEHKLLNKFVLVKSLFLTYIDEVIFILEIEVYNDKVIRIDFVDADLNRNYILTYASKIDECFEIVA